MYTSKKVMISWIPTASGKLSYRLIGKGGYSGFFRKGVPEYVNVEIENMRYIVVRQERRISDSIIPDKNGNWIFYFVGAAEINICEGTSMDFGESNRCKEFPVEGCLNGMVIAIHKYCNRKVYIENAIRELFRNFHGAKKEKEKYFLDVFVMKLKSIMRHKFTNKENDIFIVSNFYVFRNGLCLLEGIRSSKEYDSNENIFNQIYFFIRDISHKHKHHDDNEDTILTCYEFDREKTWKLKLLNSLYFAIIDNSRHKKPSYSSRGEGMLAYAISLKKILLVDTRHNSEALKNSMHAIYERRTASKQEEIAKIVSFISVLAVFITLFIGLFPSYDIQGCSNGRNCPKVLSDIYNAYMYILETRVLFYSIALTIFLTVISSFFIVKTKVFALVSLNIKRILLYSRIWQLIFFLAGLCILILSWIFVFLASH